MVYHLTHKMLAHQNAADTARSRFVLALKRHLVSQIRSANGVAYEMEAVPAFQSKNDRTPQTLEEALEAFSLSRHYQTWSALNRTSQEMMWQTVAESIYRDQERLETEASHTSNANEMGSIDLDPNFEPDADYTGIGIHLQPHSYIPDDPSGTDISAGAFYEMGGRLYSMGRGMAAKDSKAESVLIHLREIRPGWAPKRILDMGCSAGGGTVPYAEAFPEAEVHGIDLGASMLRYAHARAESLGHAVHFHQMDAARTKFPDGYFDLIISHNLLHEISGETRDAVAKETRRLLAPGGIAVHQDVDLLFDDSKELWEKAERAWDHYHNHELFWLDYATSDMLSDLRNAEFEEAQIKSLKLPKTSGPGYWQAFVAEKELAAA